MCRCDEGSEKSLYDMHSDEAARLYQKGHRGEGPGSSFGIIGTVMWCCGRILDAFALLHNRLDKKDQQGKLMWYVDDGTLVEIEDHEEADHYARRDLYSSSEVQLVRVVPVDHD